MGLVVLQRWWRKHLLARYERKAKALEAQQDALRKKMEHLEKRMGALDGLQSCKDQRRERQSRSSNSNQQSAVSLKRSPDAYVEEKQTSREQEVVVAPASRRLMHPLKLQSPVMMSVGLPTIAEGHAGALPNAKSTNVPLRYQDAIEAVEMSLVSLIRVVTGAFDSTQKMSSVGGKTPPVVLAAATQQMIRRLLTDVHSNLLAAMQAHDSPGWTTINNFDDPLPYSLGSLPWKRLMDDWAKGDTAKIGDLTRWLALALNPGYTDALPPLEVTCLQPVVLEGFLRLVVPTLRECRRGVVVQTKPMEGSILRVDVFDATYVCPPRVARSLSCARGTPP
ncbi:hypothetical protein DYB32_001528 [Aphanomyces invadans]|uniref:Dynein heavy chain C-terminal domain-containing protein n=1 Tax=Aphanomyces invadans TaxID=157072 RepID=A0A418B6E5_9STRA|nr:hypothetical protein DYB32_001528 [Aphanomyces invadans]